MNKGPSYQPEIAEELPWQEGQTTIPDYPKDANLLEVSVDIAHKNYRHLIDSTSLSIGEDGVVRYTLALESRSGVRNVFFEGINCDTREYKRYAYGTSSKVMQRVRVPKWRFIINQGSGQFRYELYHFYLCNRGSPLGSVEDILKQIRHGDRRNGTNVF